MRTEKQRALIEEYLGKLPPELAEVYGELIQHRHSLHLRPAQ